MLQDVDNYRLYLTQYRKITNSSISSYMGDVEQFVAYLQERNTLIAEEISEEDLREYGDYLLAEGWKKTTVARKIVSAKAFYKYLYRNHQIDLEKADLLQAPRIEKQEIKYLSQEEMTLLVEEPSRNTVKEIRDRAILELLYATGMKVSELISLKREDFDLQMDCVKITHGGEQRVVPYGGPARDALLRYLSEARIAYVPADDNTYIFLNHSGNPLSRQGVFKLVRKYGQRAKIEQIVTPDMIRHSFAKHLLENGANLSSVQKMLGHSSASITVMYIEKNISDERAEHKKAHPRG